MITLGCFFVNFFVLKRFFVKTSATRGVSTLYNIQTMYVDLSRSQKPIGAHDTMLHTMQCVDLRPRHLLMSSNEIAPYEFCKGGHQSWEHCGTDGRFWCQANMTENVTGLPFVLKDHDYYCTFLGPKVLLNHETEPAPLNMCLGGIYSWKRCDEGKFLCRKEVQQGKNALVKRGNCNSIPKMLPSEFYGHYRCEPEKYISQTISMLSECPSHPAINKSAMSMFWEQKLMSSTHVAKLQIVEDELYYLFNEGASHTRFRLMLTDILEVMKECILPSSEFFIWAHDGFNSSVLPLSTMHGPMCVPLFVQEMTISSRAILAPPRSLAGFTDLSDISRKDNWIEWSDKISKAVWRGSTTGGTRRISTVRLFNNIFEYFPREEPVCNIVRKTQLAHLYLLVCKGRKPAPAKAYGYLCMVAGGTYARNNWREMARSKLVLLARRRPDLLDAGFTSLDVQMSDDGTDSVMAAADMDANRLSHEQQNR